MTDLQRLGLVLMLAEERCGWDIQVTVLVPSPLAFRPPDPAGTLLSADWTIGRLPHNLCAPSMASLAETLEIAVQGSGG